MQRCAWGDRLKFHNEGDNVRQRNRGGDLTFEIDAPEKGLVSVTFGTVKVIDAATGKHRTTVNIEKAAKLRTYDDKRGLGFEQWKPFPGAEVVETLAVASQTGEEDLVLPTMPLDDNEAA